MTVLCRLRVDSSFTENFINNFLLSVLVSLIVFLGIEAEKAFFFIPLSSDSENNSPLENMAQIHEWYLNIADFTTRDKKIYI